MPEYQQGTLNAIRSQPDCERAVIFLHGFSGDRDDTWDRPTRTPWHRCFRLGYLYAGLRNHVPPGSSWCMVSRPRPSHSRDHAEDSGPNRTAQALQINCPGGS